eukprot:gene31841-7047_t
MALMSDQDLFRLLKESQMSEADVLAISDVIEEMGADVTLSGVRSKSCQKVLNADYYHVKVTAALMVNRLLWFSGPENAVSVTNQSGTTPGLHSQGRQMSGTTPELLNSGRRTSGTAPETLSQGRRTSGTTPELRSLGRQLSGTVFDFPTQKRRTSGTPPSYNLFDDLADEGRSGKPVGTSAVTPLLIPLSPILPITSQSQLQQSQQQSQQQQPHMLDYTGEEQDQGQYQPNLKRPASGKLPLLGPKRRATALAVPKPKVEEDQHRATGPGADFNAQNIFRVQEDQQNPKMLKDQMLEDQIREDQMRKEEHRMREEQMREDEMLENEMLEDQRRQDQRRAAALREQEPKSCSTSRTEAQDAGESTESDDAGGSVESDDAGGSVASDDAGGSVESNDVGGLVESDDAGGSVESDDTGGSVESDDTGGSVESDDAGRSREVFHSSRICAKKEDEEGYPAVNPHIAPTN